MSFLCWPTVCVSCDLFISNCGRSYILLHGTLLKIASVPLLLILAAQNWQLPNDALALNQQARLRRGGSIAMMISVGREAPLCELKNPLMAINEVLINFGVLWHENFLRCG